MHTHVHTLCFDQMRSGGAPDTLLHQVSSKKSRKHSHVCQSPSLLRTRNSCIKKRRVPPFPPTSHLCAMQRYANDSSSEPEDHRWMILCECLEEERTKGVHVCAASIRSGRCVRTCVPPCAKVCTHTLLVHDVCTACMHFYDLVCTCMQKTSMCVCVCMKERECVCVPSRKYLAY